VRVRVLFSGELRDDDPIRKYFPSGFLKCGDEVDVAEEDMYLFSKELFEVVADENSKAEAVTAPANFWINNDEGEEVED
jgi:hypothetical protein